MPLVLQVAQVAQMKSGCISAGNNGMFRKLASIVFQTHTIQICIQNLYILNTFAVNRYQINN